MWKKFLAALVGTGLAVLSADAQAPSGSPQLFPPAPGSSAPSPQNARGPGAQALASEGFDGAVFAPPGLNRGFVIPVNQPAAEQTLGMPPQAPPVSQFVPTQYVPPDPWGETSAGLAAGLYPEDAVRGAPGSLPMWHVWGSIEGLDATTRGVHVPAIVTTGPESAGYGKAGAIGEPSTVPIFGGRTMLDNLRGGVRIELGAWFDDSHTWGIAVRFYTLYDPADKLNAAGDGTSVINVPQMVEEGGKYVQVPVYVSYPKLTTGYVTALTQTSFSGGDISLREALLNCGAFRLEGLFGYRQMQLGDQLGDNFESISSSSKVPSIFGVDFLRTRNNYYGAQMGGIASFACDKWTFKAWGILGIGDDAIDEEFTHTREVLSGTSPIPVVATDSGGRLNYFGTVLDGGVRVGYQVCDNVRLTMSYNAIFWSNVLRAQQQYNLSATPMTGSTNYLVRMFSLGVEMRY